MLSELKQEKLNLLEAKYRLLQQSASLDYKPHAKQLAFHRCGAQERLFLAGNRVGKTLAGAFELVCHLTGEYPSWWQGRRFDKPIEAWAASVTTEVTRDILQAKIVGGEMPLLAANKVISKKMRVGIRGAIDTLEVRHVSGGMSTLGFKSYDQGREKFQGTSRHVILLDEEPSQDIYDECLLRTLDVGGLVMLTMTPLLGLTPLIENYMNANSLAGKTYVQAGWNDTEHLSNTEKERLRASLAPHELEARERGVPSLGSGRVYPVAESQICCDAFTIPDDWRRVIGIDFGWQNPTAAVWLAISPDDEIYLYDVYQQAETTPAEHTQNLRRHGDWIPIVGDPAGQGSSQSDGKSLFGLYAKEGVYIHAANNALESGLMTMLQLMQAGQFKVFTHLEDWWREFRTYRRGKGGSIVKRNDHLLDATRYAVMSGLGIARIAPKPTLSRMQRPAWWAV